ncbi:MAG: tRNA (adenosine(37)-N6)-threonylcarbamoyltransferase complex ATPase subunit type 1 TsaE [Maribacter sp.]|nr:MAG: tRNA (adenosine(37)-N6)-threonylcarbamoyltransferase complex ATPase subunit type 1 TsaE [Maribacter sp.]
MQKITYTENKINDVARQIIENAPHKLLCFHGQMGAGKTTLIRAIMKNLGVLGEANSPTFGIVNEYHDENGEPIAYHFDFYRLNDENEAFDLGIEDYLNSDIWVFMEWAEKVSSILPEDTVEITIEVVDKSTRTLILPQ